MDWTAASTYLIGFGSLEFIAGLIVVFFVGRGPKPKAVAYGSQTSVNTALIGWLLAGMGAATAVAGVLAELLLE